MRVVFDINLLVRVVLRSKLAGRILRQTLEGGHSVLVSDFLLDEFDRTVAKPRLAASIDHHALESLRIFLVSDTEFIENAPPFPPCRDLKDAYLLALAERGAADRLVTNDQDLLCEGRIGECAIVTPEEFAKQLAACK